MSFLGGIMAMMKKKAEIKKWSENFSDVSINLSIWIVNDGWHIHKTEHYAQKSPSFVFIYILSDYAESTFFVLHKWSLVFFIIINFFLHALLWYKTNVNVCKRGRNNWWLSIYACVYSEDTIYFFDKIPSMEASRPLMLLSLRLLLSCCYGSDKEEFLFIVF